MADKIPRAEVVVTMPAVEAQAVTIEEESLPGGNNNIND
jgi:hypothetical protein